MPGDLLLQIARRAARPRRRCRGAGDGSACCRRSSSARSSSCSLLRAHALELAQPAGLGRRLEIVERRDPQLARRAARPSSGRRPAAGADRAASAGTAPAAPGERRRCPVSQISTMRAERSLPMPGHSRSCAAVEAGDRLGAVGHDVGAVAIRADLERVLALQLEQVGDLAEDARDGEVIERPCDAAEPVGFDAKVEQPGAARGERRAHRRAACPGGARQNRQPPPPAPHTLAAWAPAASARAIRSSMCGVVTPGARRLRLSHSSARWRAGGVPVAALERRRASRAAVSRMRSKQSKTCRSPSMWRFMMSQLFVPELRGAPV